jgi:Sulfotransferase domain
MTFAERMSRRLSYGKPIIVVSGLPRTGTSMLMNMLLVGGVPLLTDGIRSADSSNSRGYFEYEPVKELEKNGNPSWLPHARGKAVKIISFLVTWLPETYDYRVIFMQRELSEVIASQHEMLAERGELPEPPDQSRTRRLYENHLTQVTRLLVSRPCFRHLMVPYRDAVENPAKQARRISEFLDRRLDVNRMAAVVDPQLYRSRR